MRVALPALALLLVAASTLAAFPARAQGDFVLVVAIDDAITKSTLESVQEAIAVAELDGAKAVVLELNTPGGGLEETLAILDAMTRTPLPVIGYVFPSGGSAVSAGTMILVSADLAAMAPFSTIGSVQPVIVGPEGLEPVEEAKIINFLVENLAANMAKQGRNASLAERFVVDNLNLQADAALERGAIELVATDIRDLLAKADGRTTVLKGVTLDVAGATIVRFEPSLRLRVLSVLSNPFIAGLLLIIGLYALIFGVSAPGHGAEVFGVIAIVLALVGLGLSVDPLAIFLILLGVAFLLVEVFTPGFGVFGAAGIVSVLVGTLFLAPIRPPEFVVSRDYQIALLVALLIPTAAVGTFLLFALYKVLQVRRRKPVWSGMVGETARTVDPVGPEGEGYVMYEGELWLARSEEPIPPEAEVYIHAKDGPVLFVAREPPPPPEKRSLWRRWWPRGRRSE
jgi:membrane-bound serine protease (ClpP class)